jgi:hypothetical protein
MFARVSQDASFPKRTQSAASAPTSVSFQDAPVHNTSPVDEGRKTVHDAKFQKIDHNKLKYLSDKLTGAQ